MTVSEEKLRILKMNNSESHLETRSYIKSALIQLLKKKKYNEISMTDIINKSGVSRSGVYKNFKCKDDIILEIFQEPIDEVISSLGSSIFDNIEMIFKVGKKHEKAFQTIVNTGLEYKILNLMNKQYENVSVSFYIPLWIGMIYNSFFEWVKTGMTESVDSIVKKVNDALKLIAESIETGLTNNTQNQKL